jgi:hypothetical protein
MIMMLLIGRKGNLTYFDDKGEAHTKVFPKFSLNQAQVFIQIGLSNQYMNVLGQIVTYG